MAPSFMASVLKLESVEAAWYYGDKKINYICIEGNAHCTERW